MELLFRQDLLAAGYTDTEVRTLLRRGSLRRLAAGAYVESTRFDALSADERHRMTVIATAAGVPDLVVSHASAAAIHRLPLVGVDTTSTHLTRVGRGGARVSGSRTIHAGDLPDSLRCVVDGVQVTSVARTLVDLGRTAPSRSAVVAADAALHRRLTDHARIDAALARARCHAGVARARRALHRADERSESPGESVLRLTLVEQGLTGLELQIEIRDPTGRFVGRADLGCLEDGVLIEFDGKVKYGALLRPGEDLTDVILAEKVREQRLTELGWLVLRVTWDELARPAVLARRVRDACVARRTSGIRIRGSARPAERHQP